MFETAGINDLILREFVIKERRIPAGVVYLFNFSFGISLCGDRVFLMLLRGWSSNSGLK